MKKLGALLQGAGLIDEVQLIRALSHQRKWRCKLGRSLVELGFVDDETIAKTVAQQMEIPYVEFDPKATPSELLEILPHNLAEEKTFFPIGYSVSPGNKKIIIAFSEPGDTELMETLSRHAGMQVEAVIAKDKSIRDAVRIWEEYKSSNAQSSPQAQLASAHIESSKQASSADPPKRRADPFTPTPPARPAVSTPPPSPSPPPPPSPPQSQIPDVKQDVVSVEDLPSIEETAPEIAEPEVIHAEAWEQAMPENRPQPEHNPATPDTAEPQQVEHSQLWEHAMPEGQSESMETTTDAVPVQIDAVDSEAPQVNHAEAWEQVMPGAQPIERKPEAGQSTLSPEPQSIISEPWEDTMPREIEAEKSQQPAAPAEPVVPPTPEPVPMDAPIPSSDDIMPDIAMPEEILPNPNETTAPDPVSEDADTAETVSANDKPVEKTPPVVDDEPEPLPIDAMEEVPEKPVTPVPQQPKPTPPPVEANATPPTPKPILKPQTVEKKPEPKPKPQAAPQPIMEKKKIGVEETVSPVMPNNSSPKSAEIVQIMKEIRALRKEVIKLGSMMESVLQKLESK